MQLSLAIPIATAIIAATVSATISWTTARRAQFERVINVLDLISSSTVADARHELGSIIHSGDTRVENEPDIRKLRIKDLFTVLWAIQRIHAVNQSISNWANRPKSWLRRMPTIGKMSTIKHTKHRGPRGLLRNSCQDWISYWKRNLPQVRIQLGLSPESTKESEVALNALAEEWAQPMS